MLDDKSLVISRPQFVRIGEVLIEPDKSRDWQAGGTFAPAVIKDGAVYHMVFRAFSTDRVSRLGYAKSVDGLKWDVAPEPLLEPLTDDPQEQQGMEDPRIVKLDGRFVITYTAANGVHTEAGWDWTTRIRFLVTTDFKHFERILPKLPEENNKDALLFPEKIDGKYWLVHRLMPDIWVSKSDDLVNWEDHRKVFSPVPQSWESMRIGGGAQPIETPLGWLLFYHGVNKDFAYSIGAAIVAADDPYQLLYRLPYSILSPETPYEQQGVVPQVVFATSVLEEGNEYRLYYGAADRVIAAARIDKTQLLAQLKLHPVTAQES